MEDGLTIVGIGQTPAISMVGNISDDEKAAWYYEEEIQRWHDENNLVNN